MIIYKDILGKLDNAGYTTYRLRKEKILSESTLTRIRNNQGINVDTLYTICRLTNLQINDLVEFRFND